MHSRRQFVLSLGASIAATRVAFAQRRVPTLGILLVGNREPFMTHFFAGMRDLRYVDGQTIQVQFRSAEGKLERLPSLAEELVSQKSTF